MNSYSGNVKIIPEKKYVEAELEVNYILKESDGNELIFYLNHNLEVHSLIGDDVKSYTYEEEIESWNMFIIESRKIRIVLKEQKVGKPIHFKLSYSGKLEQAGVNDITKDLVECGIYICWYPLTPKLEEAVYDFIIDLPENYKVMNATLEDSYHHLLQDIPSFECTLIASPQLKLLKGNEHFDVYYMLDEQLARANQALNYVQETFDFYNKIFGTLQHNHKTAFCLVSRVEGGGYGRPNAVVIANSNYDLFIGIAHELAHQWWLKADVTTYEDWLNESFAQYSALIALRERDQEKFEKIYLEHLKYAEGTPPIPTIKREDEQAYVTLYVKGPILLFKLEDKIGKEQMMNFLNKLHGNIITNTESFFELLSQVTSTETKDWFKQLFYNE